MSLDKLEKDDKQAITLVIGIFLLIWVLILSITVSGQYFDYLKQVNANSFDAFATKTQLETYRQEIERLKTSRKR